MAKKALTGMILGFVGGIFINVLGNEGFLKDFFTDGILFVGGQVFVRSLTFLLAPIILVSLTCGIASLNNLKTLGQLGCKTLGFYLGTTAVAVALAILVAILFQPGIGIDLGQEDHFLQRISPMGPAQLIVSFFPSNFFGPMANAHVLQIILISCFLGVVLPLAAEAGKRVLGLLEDLNKVILAMMSLILKFMPYGVFCLTATVFAEQGMPIIVNLGKYFFCVLFALFIHLTFVYAPLIKYVSGLSVLTFAKKAKDFTLLSFSTSSSSATLPVTLDTLENKMGASKSISSFTLPLGATVHMDGSAIMQGVATVFIAQVYGIDLTLVDLLLVVVMATLAAVGTATLPSAGLITLTMVLEQVNLPVEGIGIIIGVDRILDMARTTVNVIGDATVSLCLAKQENQLDVETFNRMDNLKLGG